MSHETERQEAGDQSPYDVKANALINRWSALVEYAQAITFPPLRQGVSAPPDMTGWSRWRRIAFAISSPWPTTFTLENSHTFAMLGVWLIASLYWYFMTYLLFGRIFGTLTIPADKSEQSIWVEIVASVILAVVMALIPAAYWCWIEFFRDRRYPCSRRVILTLLFAAIVISTPYWLLTYEHRVQFPDIPFGDRKLTFWFLATYFLFVIPQATFYYRLAIDVLVLSLRLLWVVREYLRSIHRPIPKELIRGLVLEPIPIGENEDEEWRLADLTRQELRSLREWSTTNRENTDKRLLPTAMLLGALGVLANTRAFSGAIDKGLTLVYSYFTFFADIMREGTFLLATIGNLTVAAAIIALAIVFIGAMLSLFRNLVAQSLIVEACIVAEYACEQCQSNSRTETATDYKGFWKRLLRLLWKR